jgi:PAS domain S-box-containing protein
MAMFFPYFELAASLFILLFSYHIWTRHYENKTARFYVRFALIAFLASILTYSMRIAFTLEIAAGINRLSAPLVAFAFSAFAHFAIIFTKRDNPKNWKIELPLLYLTPILLTLLFLFTDQMFLRYEIFSYGIASIPGPLYGLFTLQNFVYAAWGISLFYLYSRTAPQKSERAQALFICLGSLVASLVGIVFDEIAPFLLQTRPTCPTLVFDFAFMTFAIYLAMRRYSLFAISPALAATTIIETMPDSLVVTDLDGRVLLLNDEAKKYFHVPKEEIVGREIRSLFDDKSKFEKLYDEVVNKGLEIERFEATLCDPLGQCLPSLINANALRYELGDLIGIVFIIRDTRG